MFSSGLPTEDKERGRMVKRFNWVQRGYQEAEILEDSMRFTKGKTWFIFEWNGSYWEVTSLCI